LLVLPSSSPLNTKSDWGPLSQLNKQFCPS
jgi:hypothetical protein